MQTVDFVKMNENIFTIEQKFNDQNYRLYANKVWKNKGGERAHHLASEMKTDAQHYEADILKNVVKSINVILFAGLHWIF